MSGFKGAPGPWVVRRQNGSPTTGEWMISGSKPGYLAEVRDCGSGCVKSNAQLISAAPELLEALEEAADALEQAEFFERAAKARAAIAKALGN